MDAMAREAEQLGLNGAAAVLTTSETSGRVFDPLIAGVGRSVESAETCRWSGKGANHVAIVMALIAEMLDTGKPSGCTTDRPTRVGELGYTGGFVVTRRNLKVYLAFSGGDKTQALAIANAGLVAFDDEVEEIVRRQEAVSSLIDFMFNLAPRDPEPGEDGDHRGHKEHLH